MPASEAQIKASQINGRKSKGPVSDSGKLISRSNSYKHGLTSTKVIPELEAAEVQRRYSSFCKDLHATGDVEFTLALRAATLSVRMERCVQYENAMLTERVREAEADFIPPEGVDEATVTRLRDEAGKRALFDDSKPAILARKYEAAAERGFFRALKELRQHQKAQTAAMKEEFEGELGSFSPDDMSDEEFDRMYVEMTNPSPRRSTPPVNLDDLVSLDKGVDVPISIGKRR